MEGGADQLRHHIQTLLDQRFSYFCAPHHRGKVYQALIFGILSVTTRHEVKMEHEAGEGTVVISVFPVAASDLIGCILELKVPSVKKGKQRKSAPILNKDLDEQSLDGLEQIRTKHYYRSLPPHVLTSQEFGISFAGKMCSVRSRTCRRQDVGSVQWALGLVRGSDSTFDDQTISADDAEDD
jgi:hypothetical protein